MSSDDSSHVPADRDRREAVREKAQQVQAKQSRARRIRATSLVTGVLALVAVTAIVVTWAISSAASKPLASPSNVENDGFAITAVTGVGLDSEAGGTVDAVPTETPAAVATPEATPEPTPTDQPVVDIRVYVDYLSEGSKAFQSANVQQLKTWVDQDTATLTYYPVAMLTSKSNGTKYSLRAASAAACVATHSPETFFAYNHALLTQQPELDSDGLSNSELADLAIASGAAYPKIIRTCIEEEQYSTWAKGATERALKSIPGTDGVGLTAAPMVLVNGTPYVGALDDPAEFSQFVLTIASDEYYKTASATPTPTPTP
jgi:protein-disulfide isomerase